LTKADQRWEFPPSKTSGARTDSTTYLGIYKLYGVHCVITRDSKDPKMSDKFLWARGNNQSLTVSHKLQITALKMAKAQHRLCIHIICNSKGTAWPDKEERQLLQHLPVNLA
jgi:hypothetical protein